MPMDMPPQTMEHVDGDPYQQQMDSIIVLLNKLKPFYGKEGIDNIHNYNGNLKKFEDFVAEKNNEGIHRILYTIAHILNESNPMDAFMKNEEEFKKLLKKEIDFLRQSRGKGVAGIPGGASGTLTK